MIDDRTVITEWQNPAFKLGDRIYLKAEVKIKGLAAVVKASDHTLVHYNNYNKYFRFLQ